MRLFTAIRAFFRILLRGAFARDVRALMKPGEEPAALPEGAAAEEGVVAAEETGTADAAGALALLGLLQREGRLVDFLMEEIEPFQDAQIGAAVRAIHRDCRQALLECLAPEPVLAGREGAAQTVDAEFDPGAIRLTGHVVGSPPFRGVLRHHGWRAGRLRLPAEGPAGIIAPAEVDLPGGAP